MLSLQVLVATMHQKNFELIDKMNIKSDVVFANQTNEVCYNEKKFDDNYIAKMISTNLRGVGSNRNIGILYSEAEIILFSDDDVRYFDTYSNIVVKAFEEYPYVDAFIFNIDTTGVKSNRRKNMKVKKVKFFNAFNYGAVRIAVRRSSLSTKNIFFNTNFGGGTIFSAGEDSLFIRDMLKSKLKVFTYPATIATVDQTTSTWFRGYTRKYFYDKGVLFYAMSKRLSIFLVLQDIIRHWNLYKKSGFTFFEIIHETVKARKNYDSLKEFTNLKIKKRV